MYKTNRRPFSSVYKTWSREINRLSQSICTIMRMQSACDIIENIRTYFCRKHILLKLSLYSLASGVNIVLETSTIFPPTDMFFDL